MRIHQAIRGGFVAAILLSTVSGCMTGPKIFRFRQTDEHSHHFPGSDAWWAEKAALPVGVRQKAWKGKLWPPFPRPTGPKQQFSHLFHAAHYWPYPYVCQDRAYVHNVWETQIANGWTSATTLYDYHFDPDTDTLTVPGENQLAWILNGAPERRRVAYVQTTPSVERNEARVANVLSAAQALTGAEDPISVSLRHCQPVGRPANEIQMMQALELLNLPVPVIDGGGGGGGGIASGVGGATQ